MDSTTDVMAHKENNRILLVLHLPPPVHGASMVGKYIFDSKLINKRFVCKYLNLTSAVSLYDIGKLSAKKIVGYFKLLYLLWMNIKLNKPHQVYITPNAAGKAFYKDFITVSFVKLCCGYYIKDVTPKIILHFHNKGCGDYSKGIINNWLYRLFFRNVNVILLSDLLYEDVKKYIQISRCYICNNGIPTLPVDVEKTMLERIKSKKKDPHQKQPLRILFLSNMMAEKGVWTLLNACGLLKKNGIDFRCTFVGGWKDITKDDFYYRVNELELHQEVEAVGAKYDEEKEQYWQDADVFVFPTFYHNECFPLVLLEAMQHALPCISTMEAAIPDIIEEGKSGYLIKPNDYQDLFTSLTKLANDREMGLIMGLNGFQKYKTYYTLDAFERRLCNIFEDNN